MPIGVDGVGGYAGLAGAGMPAISGIPGSGMAAMPGFLNTAFGKTGEVLSGVTAGMGLTNAMGVATGGIGMARAPVHHRRHHFHRGLYPHPGFGDPYGGLGYGYPPGYPGFPGYGGYGGFGPGYGFGGYGGYGPGVHVHHHGAPPTDQNNQNNQGENQNNQ